MSFFRSLFGRSSISSRDDDAIRSDVHEYIHTMRRVWPGRYRARLLGNLQDSLSSSSTHEKLKIAPKPRFHVKHGMMLKRGENNTAYKRRYFIITEDSTVYYGDPTNMNIQENSGIKGFFNLYGYRVHTESSVLGEEHTKLSIILVNVDPSKRIWYMKCNNEAEHRDWFEAFYIGIITAKHPDMMAPPSIEIKETLKSTVVETYRELGYQGYGLDAALFPCDGDEINAIIYSTFPLVLHVLHGKEASGSKEDKESSIGSVAGDEKEDYSSFSEKNICTKWYNALMEQKYSSLSEKDLQHVNDVCAGIVNKEWLELLHSAQKLQENFNMEISKNSVEIMDSVNSIEESVGVSGFCEDKLENLLEICSEVYTPLVQPLVYVFSKVVEDSKNLISNRINSLLQAVNSGNLGKERVISEFSHMAGDSMEMEYVYIIDNSLREFLWSYYQDMYSSTEYQKVLEKHCCVAGGAFYRHYGDTSEALRTLQRNIIHTFAEEIAENLSTLGNSVKIENIENLRILLNSVILKAKSSVVDTLEEILCLLSTTIAEKPLQRLLLLPLHENVRSGSTLTTSVPEPLKALFLTYEVLDYSVRRKFKERLKENVLKLIEQTLSVGGEK